MPRDLSDITSYASKQRKRAVWTFQACALNHSAISPPSILNLNKFNLPRNGFWLIGSASYWRWPARNPTLDGDTTIDFFVQLVGLFDFPGFPIKLCRALRSRTLNNEMAYRVN